MDQPTQELEIERLIRLAAASRACLNAETRALKHRLDFPSRLKDSLKRKPTLWMIGATVTGFVGSGLFRRKLKVSKIQTQGLVSEKSRGMIPILLGLAITAARPVVKVWLIEQLKNFVAKHLDRSGNNGSNLLRPNSSSPIKSPSYVAPGSRSR
jgi:hypothetical protein